MESTVLVSQSSYMEEFKVKTSFLTFLEHEILGVTDHQKNAVTIIKL